MYRAIPMDNRPRTLAANNGVAVIEVWQGYALLQCGLQFIMMCDFAGLCFLAFEAVTEGNKGEGKK